MSTKVDMTRFDEDKHREMAQALVTGTLEAISPEALAWGLHLFGEVFELLQAEQTRRLEAAEEHWIARAEQGS